MHLGCGASAEQKTQNRIALVLARAVVVAFDPRQCGWGRSPPEFYHAKGFEPVANGALQEFGSAAIAHAGGWAGAGARDLGEGQYFTEEIFEAISLMNLGGECAREPAALGPALLDCLLLYGAGGLAQEGIELPGELDESGLCFFSLGRVFGTMATRRDPAWRLALPCPATGESAEGAELAGGTATDHDSEHFAG